MGEFPALVAIVGTDKAAELGQRLGADQHAGHQWHPRKMTGEKGFLAGQVPDAFTVLTLPDGNDPRHEAKRILMRQTIQQLRPRNFDGGRAQPCAAGGKMLVNISGERRDILEDLLAHGFAGDFDFELLLDAGHQQQYVERIEVYVGAEKGHVVSNGAVPQFQVSAQEELDLLERLRPWIGHKSANLAGASKQPQHRMPPKRLFPLKVHGLCSYQRI